MAGVLMKYSEMIKDMEFYQSIGLPYRMERSGHSVAMYVNGVKYYASSVNGNKGDMLPFDQVKFISKVKRYILKNNLVKKIKRNYRSLKQITYMAVNPEVTVGEVFDTAYSVDISGAYWASAYKEGWLSEELYHEGLTMDKRIRLASLGTFAKRVYQYEFDGKTEKMKNVTVPPHPHVFFNQAHTIHTIMTACMAISSVEFLFYWTDGIYLSTYEGAKRCEQILEDAGYRYLTTKLVRIIRTNSGFTVEEKTKKHGKRSINKKEYKTNFIE